MSLLSVVLLSTLVLVAAYWTYGPVLSRLLRLDPKAETPAARLRDDVDYVPIEPKFLLTQHFSAVAAAGPIVGPILAGAMFGWLPALLWILIGSVLIGGVHDMTSLVASIRHQARSIADVVREHMTPRSYLLFLAFIWLALVYIVVAFTDLVAHSFVLPLELGDDSHAPAGTVAASSVLYLILPIAMGLLLKYTRVSLNWATVLFLPLVGVAIWVGRYVPLDLQTWFGIEPATAQRIWCVLLLIYCYVASIAPMWLLLQPRGHLGGFFLFIALGGGALGLILGGERAQYPAFIGWETAKGEPLFPLLFVLIACGACSGFHSMIASGTTSKQLRRETDARIVGYGTMLMEAMVAIVSLCCLMMLSPGDKLLSGKQGLNPDHIYAEGIGSFLAVIGISKAFGVAFGLMAFTTFVYDTLDVCTRLGRYVLQELTGWQGRLGRTVTTLLTAGVPLYFLLQQSTDAEGNVVPAWRTFWGLFGASNQLLAALTLIGVTVWLWQTRRARWVWIVTGLPAVLMYTMSTWALGRIIYQTYAKTGMGLDLVAWVAVVLLALAALMLVEAVLVVLGSVGPPARRGAPALAGA